MFNIGDIGRLIDELEAVNSAPQALHIRVNPSYLPTLLRNVQINDNPSKVDMYHGIKVIYDDSIETYEIITTKGVVKP